MKRLFLALLFALVAVSANAQTYTISPPPFLTAFDNNGRIINNACVWTYLAGTTTAATTYTTSTGVANANPIRSDPAGRFTAFLSPGVGYKFVYESSCTPPAHGTTLRTADNVAAMPSSSATVDVAGVAGEAISAGHCAYLSDGSGSKNTGQWYQCDTSNTYSSSTAILVGMAPVAIASGSTGSLRLVGQISGLGVATGSTYYASTAGTITSTAPANVRQLGVADSATTLILTQSIANTAECNYTTVAKTASYSPALCELIEQTSGSSITVTLPAASGCTTTRYRIGLKNDTANVMTIARTGSDTIDGATSFSTFGAQYESFEFVCNAAKTGWMIR